MKNLASLAIAVIALAGVVFLFLHQGVSIAPDPTVGSSPGPDISSPYHSWNGVLFYEYNQSMVATSSVVCSIHNPFSATSTLVSYSAFRITDGIASAQTVEVSTSTSAYATSSTPMIRAYSWASGTQRALAWGGPATTTSSGVIGYELGTGASNILIPPSQFVNLRIATGTPGTFAAYWTGRCQGTFRQL